MPIPTSMHHPHHQLLPMEMVVDPFSTAATTTTPMMDPRIWRKLSQPLLDRVLAFLPPPDFLRYRSVCRRWYSLLFSNTFLDLHLRHSPRFDWFIFFPHDPPKTTYVTTAAASAPPPRWGFLLDTTHDAWYRVPFDSLILPGFSPAASSGGLLCFISDSPGLKTVLLCNPICRLATTLPQSTTPRLFPSVGLSVTPSSLTAALAGDDLISPFAVKNLTSETFHADGATGFLSPWSTSAAAASLLPRLCNLESGRMAFAGGRFYCMNYSPFSVLAFDIASNAWSKIPAPMRRFLRSPSLVECGGKVVLVAAVEKSKLNVPRSVRMWELQPCGRAWVETERMPQQVYAQFADAEGGRGFECVGQGGVMAVTMRGSPGDVLVFNFGSKAWRWAAPCPFLHGGGGPASGLKGFGFEPRLATPAIGLVDSASSLPFQGFAA